MAFPYCEPTPTYTQYRRVSPTVLVPRIIAVDLDADNQLLLRICVTVYLVLYEVSGTSYRLRFWHMQSFILHSRSDPTASFAILPYTSIQACALRCFFGPALHLDNSYDSSCDHNSLRFDPVPSTTARFCPEEP